MVYSNLNVSIKRDRYITCWYDFYLFAYFAFFAV